MHCIHAAGTIWFQVAGTGKRYEVTKARQDENRTGCRAKGKLGTGHGSKVFNSREVSVVSSSCHHHPFENNFVELRKVRERDFVYQREL